MRNETVLTLTNHSNTKKKNTSCSINGAFFPARLCHILLIHSFIMKKVKVTKYELYGGKYFCSYMIYHVKCMFRF